MRPGLIAAMVLMSAAAAAQDGARVTTLAEVKRHRSEWAGEFVRVERVTISGFAQCRGGMASDGTGGVRINTAGMPAATARLLERDCGAHVEQPGPACRGALEFTIAAEGDSRAPLTIRDADFLPQD